MSIEQIPSVWKLAATGGFLASLAGLAALLRQGGKIKPIQIISAVLNSGLLGAVVVLVWYSYLRDNVYFLTGIAILAGLGGIDLVNFVIALFKVVIRAWANKLETKDVPARKDTDL